MIFRGDIKQTLTVRVTHVLHLPESARKLREAYLQLADWNQLRRLGECHRKPLSLTTSPEIVAWEAKESFPPAPPAHTNQMIIDLLHEVSEVALIEELDSIKKILEPKGLEFVSKRYCAKVCGMYTTVATAAAERAVEQMLSYVIVIKIMASIVFFSGSLQWRTFWCIPLS